MSANTVDIFADKVMDTSRGPSPSIWGALEGLDIKENPAVGIDHYEDFRNLTIIATPTITTQVAYGNGLKAFGSSGATLLPGGIEGGNGLVGVSATDNLGVNFQMIALPFKIATTKGKLFFECRWKISTVTDLDSGVFIGLGESMTLTVVVPITAAGILADKNVVGFHRAEGTGNNLNTTYKSDGNTAVVVKSGAISSTAGVHTVAGNLAADTFIKTGMVFDPSNNKLSFYINGVKLPDTYTVTTTAGNPFPNDVLLSPLIALLLGASNTSTLTVDWFRCAQLFN